MGRLLKLALLVVFSARPGAAIPAQQKLIPSLPPQPAILTTVAQVRALTAAEASRGIAVDLTGILTYYKPVEGQIFLQDATGGIYVVPPPAAPSLHSGDEVRVRGITVPSFSTNVQAVALTFIRSSGFPAPLAVGWRQLLAEKNDCRFVSLVGTVRSATWQGATGQNALDAIRRREGLSTPPAVQEPDTGYMLLDLQMDGGSLLVHLEQPSGISPLTLLDSKVKLEGTAGGLFDGKFQQIGAELWVSSSAHLRVLQKAVHQPSALPLTPVAKIFAHSFIRDESERVHVRGSVTLYQPGIQMVVETPRHNAVLVSTYEQGPIHVGQVVDVVGFPDALDDSNSEAIAQANILPTDQMAPIRALPLSWKDAVAGLQPYGVVAMEGSLAAEVHERHQDTLVVRSGSHVFDAVLSRTVWNQNFDKVSLPRYPIGSRIRVSGVCFVHSGGPWNTQRWFELELRSPRDVTTLAAPSWWTVSHLLYLIAALLPLLLGALVWALLLHRKVRRQTEQMRETVQSEAARQRWAASLEKERGQVLEAINRTQDLSGLIPMILRLISRQLSNRACWCELASGEQIGDPAPAGTSNPLVRRDIHSGSGERLGVLLLAADEVCHRSAGEVMEMGGSLIALAIDRMRLHETLVHRSHYDQLTNAANRFLLESRLDEALAHAAKCSGRVGLIYIDLNEFKSVNDAFGHRVGDILLQQITRRFSESLRGMDTLARVGGDEFIALIPIVRSHAELEEISLRLCRCFEQPFSIDGHLIRSGASIGIAVYPEDGVTKDELKRVADTAMYAHKAASS